MNLLRENNLRKYLSGFVLLLFVIAPMPALHRPVASQNALSTPTGLMIPLYTYPGSTWQSVIQQKLVHPSVPIIAVVNPSNGPGYSRDSNYVSGIESLQKASVIVIGYVHTSYGSRDPSVVTSDIQNWKQWYNVSGIFFDEMASVSGYENYYRGLVNYTNSLGMKLTVGNPGVAVPRSYMGIMTVLNIYENIGLPSISALQSWTTGYSKSNFALISFGISSADRSFVGNASKCVAWIFVTDANLPNPYGQLPSYFAGLAALFDNTTKSNLTTPQFSSHISPHNSIFLKLE